jgi:hypothetical protein
VDLSAVARKTFCCVLQVVMYVAFTLRYALKLRVQRISYARPAETSCALTPEYHDASLTVRSPLLMDRENILCQYLNAFVRDRTVP